MNTYHRRPKGTPGTGSIPDVPGVYYILNRMNNRMYIGQSREVHRRIQTHQTKLMGGWHDIKALQADWNAFGGHCFEFGILVTNPEHSPLSLRELERIFFRVYQSENPIYGYNTSTALQTAAAHARTRRGY